nr:hypothetical protein Iba_chr12dCG18770 [Ipomoea batatas]
MVPQGRTGQSPLIASLEGGQPAMHAMPKPPSRFPAMKSY